MHDQLTGQKQQIRVLLIENSLHTTGAFISALSMSNVLRADYDIEFVLPSTSTLHTKVKDAGVICHSLPMSEIGRSWARLLRYVPVLLLNTVRLRRLLLHRKIDVLVINDYYNLLGVLAKGTGWQGKLFTIVRLMPLNQHNVLNKAWTFLAMLFSHKVIAVSNAVARQLPASKNVLMIYNPRAFEEMHPDIHAAHNDSVVHCLYLANYIPGKGHLQCLQAFASAYKQNPSLRLRYVGGDMGLNKNRTLKATLEQATLEMGLTNVVTFNNYSNNVELDIKQADIVLNFSESESFSNTCLEASAFARPIIATRCGGPDEIVDDGVSGILVNVNDIGAMCEAILRLSNDYLLRISMGQAGRRIVRDRFSLTIFKDRWDRLLRDIT